MAAMANCSSVSQLIGVPPKASVMLAISPCRGENMICQISVTTVTDSTWDRKKSVRSTAIARVSRFSAAARISAVMVTPGTARPTNSSVLPTVGQNRRSYQRPSSPAWKPGSRNSSTEAIPSAIAVARVARPVFPRNTASAIPASPMTCSTGLASTPHSMFLPHITRT